MNLTDEKIASMSRPGTLQVLPKEPEPAVLVSTTVNARVSEEAVSRAVGIVAILVCGLVVVAAIVARNMSAGAR